ncbi:MAG: flagellar export protein FliJ [Planctomycetota bacterium]
MKKFVFQFESLLRVRRLTEQRCEREVLAKRAEIGRFEADRERLLDARREHLDALAALGTGELPMQEILAHRRMLNGIASKVGFTEEQIRQRQRELAPLQERLREAVIERKAVEQLRERRHDEYLVGVRREETAQFDEVGRQLHGQVESDRINEELSA